MQSAEIRREFLRFFESREHEIVPSSPVVPMNDPTLLFANAGMNQFKRVFTGEEKRTRPRAASSQKCIRAGGKHNDLENVGLTARHLTFFEMLGNFSFGDYFKKEACRWAWELITGVFRLPRAALWVTVYKDDEEARTVWREVVGLPDERIVSLGEKDNFWSMGDVGPCGPCSEIHYDRGPDHACGPRCGLGRCECDRFMEIWNLVFMQFDQRPGGVRTPLPRPSIDTGMGLERIASVLQGKSTVFETDVLRALIARVEEISGVPYHSGDKGTPHRVIADHVRSLSFAIADGAYPSNEERGYVLRRILRRAARFGSVLGMERPFIHELVPALVGHMGAAFPELGAQAPLIAKLIRGEEEQFGRTLKTGMVRFEEEASRMKREKTKAFPGAAAFFLHDTCGFPIDLTEQMCRERGFTVDREEFDRLMEGQKERSRAVDAPGKADGAPKTSAHRTVVRQPTAFVGYREFVAAAKVLEATRDKDQVQIVLDATPFYAESGGQVGDTGTISGRDFKLCVTDTQKQDGVIVHTAKVEAGDAAAVAPGIAVEAHIDAARRLDIQRNHTATHLVHAALREVLGKHVQQKGSLVAPDRLRFDVSHFERIKPDELARIEERVQEEILRNSALIVGEHDKDEALRRGALAFFGEKYGDRVRVVEIPGFSIELCGGAHCAATGEIGGFFIVTEASVSSGVRRIEAVTGFGAQRRGREASEMLRVLATQLKTAPDGLLQRIEALAAENRELKSGGGGAGARGAAARDILAELDAGAGERETVGGTEIVSASWTDASDEELLRVSDSLKQRPGPRVYLLASIIAGGTVRLLAGTSKDLPKGRVHAGDIAREGARIVGGGGGGRPDLAQAGGKDAARLPDALRTMRELAATALARGG